MNLLRALFLATLSLGLCSQAQADPPSAQDLEFFETKVRPVLVENCFKCHSAKEKVRGSLRLESRALMLHGGDTGPAIVPGAPGKSLLIKAITYEEPELKMPPRGKLPPEAIANLTEWVRRGAPWPEDKTVAKGRVNDFDLKERSKHWSLQPLKNVSPPASKDEWGKNPIDAFILAGLQAKKLRPAAAADKHTLLRRVTFDLTGLPPTPEEIDAFAKDNSPDAYARVVDRLLASPRYGERWGRHWLDLVRYAETMGHEFDFEIPDAWQYRDYVIRAINTDVPFDRLVMEHVAGDLLSDPRRDPTTKSNESLLGTMFWLLGEAKHSPVDSRSDQSDRIDNQIDVFSKAFLGLTVACARCHDHKFDAISTRDYYALYGYVLSSRPSRRIIDDPAPRRAILEKEAEIQEKVQHLAARQAVEQLKRQGAFHANLLDVLLGTSPSPDEFARKRRSVIEQLEAQKQRHALAVEKAIVFADAQSDKFVDWIADGEAFSFPARGVPALFDFGRSVGVQRVLPQSRASSHGMRDQAVGALRSPTFTISKNKIHYRIGGKNTRVNLILDGLQLIRDPIYGSLTFAVNTRTIPLARADAKNPLSSREGREMVWHTQDVTMWKGHRAYIEILDEGPGDITLEQVVFSDEAPPPPTPNQLVLDILKKAEGKTWKDLDGSWQQLVEETLELWRGGKLKDRADLLDRVQIINSVLAPPLKATGAPAKLTWEMFPDRAEWEAAFDALAKLAPLPAPKRAYCLCDGSAVNERVFIRGNPKNPGEETPRRFLEVFGGTSPNAAEKGSGRLDLARRMVDPKHTPILPRVIVNRLWKHHFGEGIVRTVDDFGVLGQTPSHPELLDWLANELIRNGWSFKKMHRLLLLSATYQMASTAEKEAETADPDNRLWHRMPVRRLEAETIRDALLAVSGRLDETRFGPPVPPHLTSHMQGRGRPGASGPLDGNGRRSIYLGVRRNFLNPMFLAFDYPTPFSTIGRRGVSNVPAQALTMLNNPLVLQQAEVWAKQILAKPGLDRKGRIEAMYLRALGRPPQSEETTLATRFLEEQDRVLGRVDDPRSWTELAHVVFNLKEFIFVN